MKCVHILFLFVIKARIKIHIIPFLYLKTGLKRDTACLTSRIFPGYVKGTVPWTFDWTLFGPQFKLPLWDWGDHYLQWQAISSFTFPKYQFTHFLFIRKCIWGNLHLLVDQASLWYHSRVPLVPSPTSTSNILTLVWPWKFCSVIWIFTSHPWQWKFICTQCIYIL